MLRPIAGGLNAPAFCRSISLISPSNAKAYHQESQVSLDIQLVCSTSPLCALKSFVSKFGEFLDTDISPVEQ